MEISDIKELIEALQPLGEAAKQVVLVKLIFPYFQSILLTTTFLVLGKMLMKFLTGQLRGEIERNCEREMTDWKRRLHNNCLLEDIYCSDDLKKALKEMAKPYAKELPHHLSFRTYYKLDENFEREFIAHIKNFKASEK